LTNTRPYRPSNGSEGESFHARFCDRCSRDAEYSDENPDLGCPIRAASFCFKIDEPGFPKELVEDDKRGPFCTAFTTETPPPPPRCLHTMEMFPEKP